MELTCAILRKWGMYLIYMGFCLVSELVVYFYVPETRSKPIEEMGMLFGENSEIMLHMTSDGRDIVEKSGSVRVMEVEDTGTMERNEA